MAPRILFSCSMRGSHTHLSQEELRRVKNQVKQCGVELVTEHQTRDGIIESENQETPATIHTRDYQFLQKADAVIAEISNPSLGVGGEIADAVMQGIPVLAVYQTDAEHVSAYTRGKLDEYERGRHTRYHTGDELQDAVNTFLTSHGEQ